MDKNLPLDQFLFYGRQSDVQMLILEMLTKRCKAGIPQNEAEVILCSCGEHKDAAHNMDKYKQIRQGFLIQLKNCREYTEFMRSCFPNCAFSEDCDREFPYIQEFEKHIEEITRGLAILDRRAIELYENNKDNLKHAMQCIEAELGRECSLDPKHKKFLNFPFSYEIEQEDGFIEKEKLIECQPHLKLIRRDSNLRIYFYWRDEEIEEGKKVLIGRVGRHPW